MVHSFTIPKTTRSSTRLYNTTPNENDQAKILQQKAQQLREEVEQFEQSKQEEKKQQQMNQELVQREKEDLRMRYSAEVPILKGDGSVVMERCDFPPRIKGGGNGSDNVEEGKEARTNKMEQISSFYST